MRKKQIAIGISAVVLSWYGMMITHELGHCLGALATDAKIEAVIIPMAGFSQTNFSGGRSPLLVVWAGPLLGGLIPLSLLLLTRFVKQLAKHIFIFFAGFCLLANGSYIGLGAFLDAGDCRQLLQYGSPNWVLIIFGIIFCLIGLYVWHRMGPVKGWFASQSNKN